MKQIMLLSLFVAFIAPTYTIAAETETRYFAVLMNGKKVGYAAEERTVDKDTVTTSSKMALTISRMGIPLSMTQSEIHVETRDGKPLSFESIQDMSMMRMKVEGTITDGILTIKTTNSGIERENDMPWPEGAVLAEGLHLKNKAHGLKPGTQYKVLAYQPSLKQAVTMAIHVKAKDPVDLLGRVVSLTEVSSRYEMGGVGQMDSVSYVNEDLRPEKTVIPVMGFSIEVIACAKEYALSKTESLDLLDHMLLTSPKPIRNAERLAGVTYNLRSTKAEGEISIPNTDNQILRKQEGGGMQLTVRPVEAPKDVSFPYKGKDAELLAALESNAYLQSDHKTIQRLAKVAVKDADDVAQAVRQIEAMVANYISSKDLSVGYATALEVVESKQGDCTEHAVLCAALCRAVGIPAQVVVGIVYAEEFMGRQNVFGGHAWTRAYIGDRWVGLDAAFKGTGRGGYGPGHITLGAGNGEPGDFFGIMGTLGQFTIEDVKLHKNKEDVPFSEQMAKILTSLQCL